eukprot:gene42825-52327_t
MPPLLITFSPVNSSPVSRLPDGFISIAHTSNSPHAAIAHPEKRYFGLQFHPEVTHSVGGKDVLRNFTQTICRAQPDWDMSHLVDSMVRDIQARVGSGHVIGAVSGGVDSTVGAVLVHRAIGDRFHAVMVDNGCLRKDEGRDVVHRLKEQEGIDLVLVPPEDRFLQRLHGVSEPEAKRKIIGNLFIEIFEEEARKIEERLKQTTGGQGVEFLLQGTLYPDVIESTSYKGPSHTIKTHHNVGGLPEHMSLKLLEPLRELFKDEVRQLGEALGIDKDGIWRHPFPGPGLAIRCIGEISKERLDILREADHILITELKKHNIYNEIGQAFVVLTPV